MIIKIENYKVYFINKTFYKYIFYKVKVIMGICSAKKEIDKIEVLNKSFFDFEINDIDGNLVKLSKF